VVGALKQTQPSTLNRIPTLIIATCAFIAAVALIVAAVHGWNHNLLDMHGFRQTQTAISIEYMLRGGPLLAYETPVFGPPWSWPMEFPLYQWCVAGVAWALHAPVPQTARAVGLFFFGLGLLAIYLGLDMLGLRRSVRLIFLILLLTSPMYLFWSRTCMIESCAVCLGLWFLFFTARLSQEYNWHWLFLASLAGTLTAAVKVTSFPAFAFLAVVILLAPLASRASWRVTELLPKLDKRHMVVIIVLCVVPILATKVWLAYGDGIKAQNAITANIMSSAPEQFAWNFGTMHQRLSGEYVRMVRRTVGDVTGKATTPLLFLPLLPFLRRWRLATASCVVAFTIPGAIFTNLHIIHNYYPYANGLFLLGAFGFVIADLLQQDGSSQVAGAVLLVLCTLTGLIGYHQGFYRWQTEGGDISLITTATAIGESIAPDKIVVLRGAYYSPILIYYSGHRGILLEETRKDGWPNTKQAWLDLLQKTGPGNLGALGFCFEAKDDRAQIEELTNRYGFQTSPQYSDQNCSVFYPRAR
jgi:hypothetical protein